MEQFPSLDLGYNKKTTKNCLLQTCDITRKKQRERTTACFRLGIKQEKQQRPGITANCRLGIYQGNNKDPEQLPPPDLG